MHSSQRFSREPTLELTQELARLDPYTPAKIQKILVKLECIVPFEKNMSLNKRICLILPCHEIRYDVKIITRDSSEVIILSYLLQGKVWIIKERILCK